MSNFHPLDEVVARGSDTQLARHKLQVGENLNDLTWRFIKPQQTTVVSY